MRDIEADQHGMRERPPDLRDREPARPQARGGDRYDEELRSTRARMARDDESRDDAVRQRSYAVTRDSEPGERCRHAGAILDESARLFNARRLRTAVMAPASSRRAVRRGRRRSKRFRGAPAAWGH